MRWALAPAAAALAACAILMITRAAPGPLGFHSRGGALTDSNQLAIHRMQPAGRAAPVSGVVAPDDELVLSFRNPEGYKNIMIFGMDEHRHLFWYHPSWGDRRDDPAAVPIARRPEWVELGEAIRHPLDGQRITIYALFTNQSLTVRAVEARVASAKPGEPWFAATRQLAQELRIER